MNTDATNANERKMTSVFERYLMGGIAIDNARMYDHLKAEHEKLIDETHRWFEYGQA